MAQKQADMTDYGYLLLVAMTTSCAVLVAVIATAACVVIARRHRLRHRDVAADSMSLQRHHATCPHACSLGQCELRRPQVTIHRAK